MKKLAMIGLVVWGVGVAPLAAQEKIVVGGSGSLIEVIAEIAKAYLVKNSSDSIQVHTESMSNTGGMEGVKMGRLNIGLVTDEPQGADKEKLVYKILGRTPTALAVNKILPVTNLTEAQICRLPPTLSLWCVAAKCSTCWINAPPRSVL